MKILLINPYWGEKISKKGKRYNRSFPPLDLLVIASMLQENGDDVLFYDANVNFDKEEFDKFINQVDLVIITSTPYYKWQCPNLNYEVFIDFCKNLPVDKTILYGGHVSQYPDFFLKETGFRYGIIGEPENSVLSIVDKIKKNRIEFNESGYYLEKSNDDVDIEKLPLPAFDLIEKYKRFYGYEILGNNFMIYEASRGCPFKCIYCYQGMYGKRLRKKSVAKIYNEIKTGLQYGYKNIYIYDLEFTVNKELVKGLCKQIINDKLKINWCCQGRADSLDEEMLLLMKKSGCKLIHFGVESGNDDILDFIKKKTNKEKLMNGITLTNKIGIETAGFFMFGLPNETMKNWKETIDFAKKLNPDYASFHVSSIYPNTPLYNLYLESGGDKTNLYPECFDTVHKKIDIEKVVKRSFFEYYLRFGYIFKRIVKGNPSKWLKQLKLFFNFVK